MRAATAALVALILAALVLREFCGPVEIMPSFYQELLRSTRFRRLISRVSLLDTGSATSPDS